MTEPAGFPLSVQQRRAWAHQALSPAHVRALVLDGPLDREALAAGLAGAVARHESLRTSFPPAAGLRLPLQVIAEQGEGTLEDWEPPAGGDDAALAGAARLLAAASGGEPPPLRAWIGALGPDRHVLVLAASALCADRASLDVLVDALAAAHAGAGSASSEEDEPVQYADFAGWQEGLVDDDEAVEGTRFWAERVDALEAGAGAALPGQRPAPEGTMVAGEVSAELSADQLAALARAGGGGADAAATALAACWHVVLWRFARPARFAVGHVFGGRVLDDLADAVGPFAHPLPLTVALDDELSFDAVVAEVGEQLGRARERQRFYGVGPDGERGDPAPAWQLDWQSTPRAGDWGGALTARVVLDTELGSPYDVRLSARAGEDGGLALRLSYDSSLLGEEAAATLLGALLACVESVVADPSARIDRVALLGEDSRAARLTAPPPARDDVTETWPAAVLARARTTPDAVAVEFGDEALTYAELVAQARRVAAALAQRGVAPGVRVAICLERSSAFVVCIAGALLAGGCYVPLDPDYPDGYLGRILADSAAAVLVTDESLRGRAEGLGPAVLSLDGPDLPAAEAAADFEPAVPASLDDPAYAIYTSGSTGEPKGVLVTHRSAMSLAAAMREAVYADETEPLRASVNAPFTFDASIKQLVLLAFGHTLHVLPAELRLDAHALSDHLEHRRIEVLDCTPSQLRPLLNAIEIHEGRSHPRIVLVGGEAVGLELWSALRERQGLRAVNVYGPTECTDVATWADLGESRSPVIGRPLPGVQALVADPDLQPLPAGVPGELCLAGWGVSEGYIGDPQRTAQAFVAHPADPAQRLYRTGDRVRDRADGTLEYLGRADRQVKVRGFRVDLGEIEAALSSHPGVAHVAAVDVPTATGSKRLAAFVVASGADSGDAVADALRTHAEQELPDHLRPASYEMLDELPVTAHGKVDLAALRERAAQRAPLSAEHVAPRNPTEEALAEIFRSVLDADRVGVNDDFFEAGGDSISQILVVARARERGLSLTPRDVYERPTVAQLAEVCG